MFRFKVYEWVDWVPQMHQTNLKSARLLLLLQSFVRSFGRFAIVVMLDTQTKCKCMEYKYCNRTKFWCMFCLFVLIVLFQAIVAYMQRRKMTMTVTWFDCLMQSQRHSIEIDIQHPPKALDFNGNGCNVRKCDVTLLNFSLAWMGSIFFYFRTKKSQLQYSTLINSNKTPFEMPSARNHPIGIFINVRIICRRTKKKWGKQKM